MNNRLLLQVLTPLMGFSMLATPAFAAPALTFAATAYSVLSADGIKFDERLGTGQDLPDGSNIMHKGCTSVASPPSAPTGDCFFVDPALVPTPTTWYQRPQLFTNAAAQVKTTFGTNQARSWSSGSNGSLNPDESQILIEYIGKAQSEYREEISYVGTVPTTVTFTLHLHASWGNSGRFSLAIGRPFDNPDGVNQVDGVVYNNCPPFSSCVTETYEPFFNSSLFYVTGNDAANTNGTVDQFINFTMNYPAFDPLGEESPISTFMVSLNTLAFGQGSEIDAFNTVTLDSITVQPGVSLAFGSGTQYNVLVAGGPTDPPNDVPEPGAPLLLLTALAALMGARRMKK